MKRFAILVAMIGVLMTCSIARQGLTDQQSEKKAVEPTSLEQLQKERIDTLMKLVEIAESEYKNGITVFFPFAKAQVDLVEAQLDTTTQAEERIALLERQLKIAQDVFDWVDTQVKIGFAHFGESNRLEAKAHLLTIKIKLAREQARKKT
jgi:hypothetical protein